jgi:hypothetical protein
MQEVLDRLNFHSMQHKFIVKPFIINAGVLMTNGGFSTDKGHKKFMVDKLFPIADRVGATSLLRHITFDRAFTNRNNKVKTANPRGGKLFGSRDGLCDFLGDVFESWGEDHAINPTTTAFYWESYHPQPMSYHPYVDIDIKTSKDEHKFDDIYKLVNEVVAAMDEIIKSGTSITDVKKLIAMNIRQTGPNVTKWSFHIHWPQVVMDTMTELASLVRSVNSRVPAQPNGLPLLDTAVYSSSNQLFRMPFCGKMGDDTAILLPIIPHRHTSTAPWVARLCKRAKSTIINESCTATLFPANYHRLVWDIVPRSIACAPVTMVGMVSSEDENNTQYGQWMDFWKPVLREFVVPNFIRFRENMASLLSVACSFPDSENVTIRSIARVERYPASFRLEVDGDTFCEYDHGATPHTHSFRSNSTSYVVDLHKGRVCQQCVKCRPSVLKWYNFISTCSLKFPIMDGKEADCVADEVVIVNSNTNIIPFLLKYYKPTIVYARDTKKVYVYDDGLNPNEPTKNTGVWKASSDGNRLLLAKVTELNERYSAYCMARNMHIRDLFVAQYLAQNPDAPPEDITKATDKQNAACKKANGKISLMWKLTIPQRKDLLTSLKTDAHPHHVETMEPNPHVVPMSHGRCVDLYTWIAREISPDDYFVSCLNANLLHLNDNSVEQFVAWQYQVTCGNPEYLKYKLQIMGLSLTLLNFDRAFYMPLGPVGRNGKSSESFLFNQVTMSDSTARGYYMSREYLTNGGQDKKGANAADTVMMELANKCILIADECRDTQLDCALLKALVSGDKASARNLYESERTNVECRGKLWIICNKHLKLDYTDPALMDRLRVMPYNARWVPNPAEVKARTSDLIQRVWIFQDDPHFKTKCLAEWGSAMVTKCLYELHLLLKALPRDPDHPERPVKLESIKPPSVVVNATRTLIGHEHPLLNFIRVYLAPVDTGKLSDCVPVDAAFSQFHRFGKNENSIKIKSMNRSQFQSSLLKEDIEAAYGDDGTNYLKGYKMGKEVPNLDRSDNCPIQEGAEYIPPAIKRRYSEMDDEGYGGY